jgi:hypothetical protein
MDGVSGIPEIGKILSALRLYLMKEEIRTSRRSQIGLSV